MSKENSNKLLEIVDDVITSVGNNIISGNISQEKYSDTIVAFTSLVKTRGLLNNQKDALQNIEDALKRVEKLIDKDKSISISCGISDCNTDNLVVKDVDKWQV